MRNLNIIYLGVAIRLSGSLGSTHGLLGSWVRTKPQKKKKKVEPSEFGSSFEWAASGSSHNPMSQTYGLMAKTWPFDHTTS